MTKTSSFLTQRDFFDAFEITKTLLNISPMYFSVETRLFNILHISLVTEPAKYCRCQ